MIDQINNNMIAPTGPTGPTDSLPISGKACIVCKKEYEITAEHWHKSTKNSDGRDNTCKYCKNTGRTLRRRKITQPGKYKQGCEFEFPEKYRCIDCANLKERPYNPEWEKYLGKIILTHCLELMIELPAECIDLIIMDPPYDTGTDQIINDKIFGKETIQELHRILKPDGAIYCFTNFKRYPEFIEKLSYKFKIGTPLVWLKGSTPKHCDWDYSSIMELVAYGIKGNHKLRNQNKHNVYKGNLAREHHPMQKPVELIQKIINNSSDKGDLIFDPYAGSGTTLVAAKLSERRFFGCEIDKKWYDQAITRLLECKINEVGEIIKGVDSSKEPEIKENLTQ